MKNNLTIVPLILVCGLLLFSFKITQESWEVPAKYEKMINPLSDDADSENIGKMLYAKHCKSCHGSKGQGDGPKADSVDTEIGDFSDESFKNQSDGSLYYKTYIGRDDMPSFQKKIPSKEDQWKLVNYIKKF